MSRHFREVWAVDVDAEMIQRARARAEESGSTDIRWIVGRAEDITAPNAGFELVSIGAAYHWMEREYVAAQCRRWLVEGQPLAVLGSNSTWTGSAEWQHVVLDVIRKWLGETRRAGTATFRKPIRRHEVILAQAGFDVTKIEFKVPHIWTLENFIGYLYSTSFASLHVLGDTARGFEADLRSTLLDFDATGLYEETLEFYCIIAYG